MVTFILLYVIIPFISGLIITFTIHFTCIYYNIGAIQFIRLAILAVIILIFYISSVYICMRLIHKLNVKRGFAY